MPPATETIEPPPVAAALIPPKPIDAAIAQLRAGGGAVPSQPAANLNLPSPDTAGLSAPLGPAAPAPTGSAQPVPDRSNVVNFWTGQGVPPHVAEGIADAVGGESGFNPSIPGDYKKGVPTSGGMYQHHDDRLTRLKTFAAAQGKMWTDPAVQNQFSLTEVQGGDPIAAAHWKEIQNAPDRETAKALWSRYFERPAAPGGGSGDIAAKLREGYATQAGNLEKALASITKQIGAEGGNVAEGMGRVRAALDKADEAQRTAMKAISKVPDHPEMDAVQKMSGLATLVGIFGGLLTKQPMLASINGAAAAIEAYNSKEERDYKIAYDSWKGQTDLLFKIAEMNASRVRDVLYNEQLGATERMNLLNVTLRAAGLQELADAARIKGPQAAEEWLQKQDHWQKDYDLKKQEIEATNKRTEFDLHAKNEIPSIDPSNNNHPYIFHRGETDPTKRTTELDGTTPYSPGGMQKIGGGGASGSVGVQQRAQMVQEAVDQDITAAKAANPNMTEAEVKALRWKKWQEHEREATTVKTQARSPNMALMEAYRKEHPDASEQELRTYQENLALDMANSRAFGGGEPARNLRALNTVADHILLVEEYAKALDNGQFPRANAIANQVAVELGKPEVTNFETASNIMADEVVRLLTSTGGTEADRRKMEGHISKNMSPEQWQGTVQVFKQAVGARFEALEQQFARNDPSRKAKFENEMLTPKARQVFVNTIGPSQGGTPGTTGAASPPPATRQFFKGPGGAQIYSDDGQRWFNADGTPYQPAAPTGR